jgi:hypothetical protein
MKADLFGRLGAPTMRLTPSDVASVLAVTNAAAVDRFAITRN